MGNLKMILFHSITPSNYHPLTMLSLAINYHFSQASPPVYYLTNILIHLANVVLVFLLSVGLCKRIAGYSPSVTKHSLIIATFCALWFAVHPMHVESVSWISERKDVLYAFFYLLGFLTYLNYIDALNNQQPANTRLKWYFSTFLFFFLSCLSKPMAVSFPLLLFTIDFLLKRKWDKKLFTEKIIFFVCSIFFGMVAYRIQKESGAVADFHTISLIDRILFTFYGFNMYLIKLLLPIHQNAFYPYPDITPGIALPALFYIMPVATLLVCAVPFYFKWKKKENLFRVSLFGLTFYFFNVIFILQFISCGDAIIADRYTYTAYFGPVFVIMYMISELISARPALKNWAIGLLAAISIMFVLVCQARTKVWHNPETFWSDVIIKSEMHSQLPYLNLGNYFVDSGKYEKAYPAYSLLTRLGLKDAGVFRNLAMIYGLRKQFDSSLYYFAKAIKYDSANASIYTNRAITYANLGKYDLALKDFNKAYLLDTTKNVALQERAQMYAQVGQYKDAVNDYNTLIRRNPSDASFYFDRGNALLDGGNPEAATHDYLYLLQLQPDNGAGMYYLSVAYDKLSDEKDALDYALKANQNKIQVPADYLARLQKSAR
jgi:tetratricopeptide (TPR) repeat protein